MATPTKTENTKAVTENTKAVTENTRATESSSSTGGGTAPVAPVVQRPDDHLRHDKPDPKPGGAMDKLVESTRPASSTKAETKPEAKEQPWCPPFPQPEDGRYEVKWRDDEIVWADRGNGTWKLSDGRAIDIKAWRARPK